MTCQPKGLCGGKGMLTLKEGAWANNPLAIQVLGICSALAVTNRLENSLVMGAALIFVCVGSNLLVSLLRKVTPYRFRMIAEVAIIATFVIMFDQFLRAFYFDLSKQLSIYVGLIITNCIVMGRLEAFAMGNKPYDSMLDAFGSAMGYSWIIIAVAFFRELLGSGKLFGFPVFASIGWETFPTNGLMVSPVGAFIILGIIVWVQRTQTGYVEQH